MKKYIIMAGVNGAGKSTLYRTMAGLQTMPRVNTDEILREFGDWRNGADVMTAGKEAVKRMRRYLETGVTFNQETTLCGKLVVKEIRRAKSLGFCIEMHYVGVESADIAKSRVARRVERGGHGIPEKDIEKRYIETFCNLREVLPICDLAVFYDNTRAFERFAVWQGGGFVRISEHAPEWFRRFAEDGAGLENPEISEK